MTQYTKRRDAMKKGLFITFEGIDGCGKTTQIELLKENLEEKGYTVLLTREPGAKGLGEKLREILLNYDGEVSSNCESFLFLADRAQHIDTIIKPAIDKGVIVLCDRHKDSTVAYQGYGRQLDLEQIYQLNKIATNGITPDITFILDIDIDTSLQRIGKGRDRMENSGREFFERVREGYIEISKQEPQRVKLLQGNSPIKDIQRKISDYVQDLL